MLEGIVRRSPKFTWPRPLLRSPANSWWISLRSSLIISPWRSSWSSYQSSSQISSRICVWKESICLCDSTCAASYFKSRGVTPTPMYELDYDDLVLWHLNKYISSFSVYALTQAAGEAYATFHPNPRF